MNLELEKNKNINNTTNKTIRRKYKTNEKFAIATKARKTIKYIENSTNTFPKTHQVLKNKIITNLYDMLENIYRANIFQEIEYKKEIIVNIQLLNFYIEESYNKNFISYKKLINYGRYLLELDSMVRSWMSYETSK